MKDLSRELHTGRGFFVLKTIPVDSYSREDNILIYAGVSSYVGNRRGVQDIDDSVLAHIERNVLTILVTDFGDGADVAT